MPKIKDQVNVIRSSLKRRVSDVRQRIEDFAHDEDLEKKVESILQSFKNQDFMKNPRIQELMERVRNRVQSSSQTTVASIKKTTKKTKDSISHDIAKVERELSHRLESLGNLESAKSDLEELLKERAPLVFKDVTQKLSQSILKKAEQVRGSLNTHAGKSQAKKAKTKSKASGKPTKTAAKKTRAVGATSGTSKAKRSPVKKSLSKKK